MEINGIIKSTGLTLDGIFVEVQIVINEQSGTASFVIPTTVENIAQILAVAGQKIWEQLGNTPVKCKLVEEDGGYRLAAIGHFMLDKWLEIPKPESECDCEKECNCDNE